MTLLSRITNLLKEKPPAQVLAERYRAVADEARQAGFYTEAKKLEVKANEVVQ